MSRFQILRFTVGAGLGAVFCAVLAAQALTAPKFNFDPQWPKPLPNKWKMGGVTGLAVDRVYTLRQRGATPMPLAASRAVPDRR